MTFHHLFSKRNIFPGQDECATGLESFKNGVIYLVIPSYQTRTIGSETN